MRPRGPAAAARGRPAAAPEFRGAALGRTSARSADSGGEGPRTLREGAPPTPQPARAGLDPQAAKAPRFYSLQSVTGSIFFDEGPNNTGKTVGVPETPQPEVTCS